MRFKRNAIYIEGLLLQEVLLSVVILFVLFYGNAIVWKDIILISGMMIVLLLSYFIFFRGLFYDTVYYDEKSIRIVTRKKTWEYTWDEVLRIERIIGGRSGTLGWRLVALTGEKHEMYPFSARFIEFVKKNTPYLEIRMMP